ncbi:MAG: hypothetical protein QFE16_04465 [Pseudomonadota bacterium]|nr:hypothetical protein [Pseudomonadota bacterium]
MLATITAWFAALAVAVFIALWDFVTDICIGVFDLFLSALATLIAAVPLPDFVTTGLSGMFAGLGNDILFIVSHSGLAAALALIGTGFAFRLTRKIFTLFQW